MAPFLHSLLTSHSICFPLKPSFTFPNPGRNHLQMIQKHLDHNWFKPTCSMLVCSIVQVAPRLPLNSGIKDMGASGSNCRVKNPLGFGFNGRYGGMSGSSNKNFRIRVFSGGRIGGSGGFGKPSDGNFGGGGEEGSENEKSLCPWLPGGSRFGDIVVWFLWKIHGSKHATGGNFSLVEAIWSWSLLEWFMLMFCMACYLMICLIVIAVIAIIQLCYFIAPRLLGDGREGYHLPNLNSLSWFGPHSVNQPEEQRAAEPGFESSSDSALLPFAHQECCICLSGYEVGEEPYRLPCAHRFHSTCIHSWLCINSVCPVCRRRF